MPDFDENLLGRWTGIAYWNRVMPDRTTFTDWGLVVAEEDTLACGTILVRVYRKGEQPRHRTINLRPSQL